MPGLLWSFVIGAGGWWIAQRYSAPLISISRLGGEVHEALFLTETVGKKGEDETPLREPQKLLLALAAKLAAANATVPYPYAVHLLLHGNLDLPKAITGLRALSHALGTSDGSRALERGKIERALNLPLENTDEALEEISRIRDKTMWHKHTPESG